MGEKKGPPQGRFAVMGENLFRIVSKIMQNDTICRLLTYLDENPLDDTDDRKGPVDGFSLLNKNIIIVPKIPEPDAEERAFIIVVFDKFIVNPDNADFKISTIRFDVVCPFNEWIINGNNLRPYLIMQELDRLFNQAKLSGIGNLQFLRSEPLVLSPQMGGYTMYYQINEFN